MFFDYFSDFFDITGKSALLSLGRLQTPAMSSSHSSSLEEPFTMDEIERALNETDPSKASSPDGLDTRFLKSIWQWIKQDIWSMSQTSFTVGSSPKALILLLHP